jgi:small-conductance mechanosensitive channel
MPYITLIVCAVLWLAYALLRHQPGILDETGMRYLWFATLISVAVVLIHVVIRVLVDLLLVRARGQRVSSLLRLLLSVPLYAIAVIVIARVVLGVDILALATASAVMAVIIGIALQSTMSNLFSGIAMVLEWPMVIRIGDVVRVGDHSGPLESITWRSMSLRMPNGALLVVPNSTMAAQVLEVFPAHEATASRISVPAPVAVAPRKIFEVIADVIRTAPGVNPAVKPMIHCGEIRITDHGEALMTYDIFYYPLEYREALHTDAVVRERIWYAFARTGIIQSYGRKPAVPPDDDAAVIPEVPALLGLDSQLRACLLRDARTHLYAPGEPIAPPRAAQCSLFMVARGTVSVRASATEAVERSEAPAAIEAETSISRQHTLDRIAAEYAEHIGPIAGIVVRNAARHCDDPYQLYQLLAEDIADPEGRAAFLSNAPKHRSVQLHRGDHFGGAAYVSGHPERWAEMHALDEVELVELDRHSLVQAMADDPEGAAEFCRSLSDIDTAGATRSALA